MFRIMVACAHTGAIVPTGISTDIDTFAALPEVPARLQCPACGGNHYWTKSETWICEVEGPPRALLPAEVLLRH